MNRFFLLFSTSLLFLTACSSDEPIIIDSKEDNPFVVEDRIDAEGDTIKTPIDDEIVLARINLSAEETMAMRSLSEFNYNLLCEYVRQSDGVKNISVSPVSVSIFFSMLANATDGEAQQEIFNLLKINNLSTLNSLSGKLMEYLPTESGGASLSIANRFWVANRFSVPETFSTTVKDFYNADVVAVDFTKPDAVPSINGWISQNTNGLISSLLNGPWESYTNLTSVGANTVYFRSAWKSKFDKQLTKKESFYTPDGEKSVNMMHKVIRAYYASNDLFQLVELPYKSEENKLELYLPKSDCSPEEMVAILTPDIQNSLNLKRRHYDVTLSLPKFESQNEQQNLTVVLSAMGCDKLFRAAYIPMGITETTNTLFSHQTVVKVDEDGTELAAVTGGFMLWAGPGEYESPQDVTVTFDRPFIYIVRNRRTEAILMAGVVTDPQ